MPEYDGEVIIHAGLDKGDFESDIDRLSRLLQEKKSQIESLKAEYASYIDRTSKTKEQLDLEKEINEVFKQRDKLLSEYYNSLQTTGNPLPGFVEKLNEINASAYKLQKNLENVKINPQSTQSVKDLSKEISTASTEAEKLRKKLDKAISIQSGNIIKDFNKEFKESIKNSISASKQRLSSADLKYDMEMYDRKSKNDALKFELAQKATKRTEMLNKSLSLLSNTTSKFGSVFKGVFSTIISPINSVISGISTLGKRILRLGSYVLIFNVIRGGFRQFRDYVTAALSTNDTFMSSLNKLKSNLMVAFYPIYQLILPALNTLMSFLIKASSYLANFFSILTGTTIKQSEAGARAIYSQQQAMKSSGDTTKKSTEAINDQKASFDKLGKSIKGSKKELASFDKLIILGQNKEKSAKTPKAPKADDFVFMPDTKIPEPDLKWMDDFNKNLQEKLKPTIESFKILGDAIKDKLGGFAKKAVENFNKEYLEPMSDYIFKKAIPKFNRITTDMINETDWDNLNNSLNNFWKALEPFHETIGDGLLAFYENVIKPFTEWAIGNLIPAAFDALTGALKFLNPVAKQAGDFLGKVYDKFLKPAAEWTGELIVNGLKGIGDALSTIGDWIDKNSWFVEIVGSLIIGITTALIGYNAVMFVTSGALAKAATAAWSFTTALLANPITWIVVLIGSLIAALILLVIHWEDVKKWGTNTWESITESASKSWEKIKEWWGGVSKWFDETIAQPIKKSWEDYVTNPLSKGWDMVSKGWKSGLNGLIGLVENFVNRCIDGLNWLIKKANKISFDMPDWLGGGHFGINISEMQKASLPRLAQGAVLKGGDPILAYLNDQPRGQTNIETPLDTMVQAFNEALSNNNANGNVVIQADGDVAGIVNMLRFRIKQRDELIGTNYIQDGIFA